MFSVVAVECHAEPSIPKEKIPPNAPKPTQALLEQLYSPKPLDRVDAAKALAETPEAVPFLVGMLHDDVEAFVKGNFQGYFGGRATFEAYSAGTPAVAAAKALITIGPPAMDELLDAIRKAKDADFHVPDSGKRPMSRDPDRPLPFTRGSKPPARVVTLLGRMKDPKCIERLCSSLKDDSPRVRWASIRALAEIHADKPPAEYVIRLLEDPAEIVRVEAILVLARSEDPRAEKLIRETQR
jgi:HEAT repeat protein